MSAAAIELPALRADVLRAREGDRDAFARLVDAWKNVVCSIALAIVRDVAASEDVAQEVFLAAWSGLGRLRNPDSFLPWLRQLTRNRARETTRGRRRYDLAAEDAIARAVSPDRGAVEELLGAEEQRALAEAIDELGDDAREVITLYYREGESIAQVATLLGLSEEAVKKRLSRGRASLREAVHAKLAGALARSAPGDRFSHAVILALPAFAPAAGGTGAAALAQAGKSLALVSGGAALGTLGGLAGVWLGIRKLWPLTRTEDERRSLKRLGAFQTALVLVTSVAFVMTNRTERPMLWSAVVFVPFFAALMASARYWKVRATATWEAEQRARDPEGHARRIRRRNLVQIAMLALGAAFVIYLLSRA